jgi:GTPase involved in cell partitioning and DNA repair
MTLQEIIDCWPSDEYDYDRSNFHVENNEVNIELQRPTQTEESFRAEVREYEEKLVEYEQWKKDNAIEIKRHELQQKGEKLADELNKLQDEIEALDDETGNG